MRGLRAVPAGPRWVRYEALIKACSGAYGASQECAQMQQDLDSQAAGLNMCAANGFQTAHIAACWLIRA